MMPRRNGWAMVFRMKAIRSNFSASSVLRYAVSFTDYACIDITRTSTPFKMVLFLLK